MLPSITRRQFIARSTASAVGLAIPGAVFNFSPRRALAADEPLDLLIRGGTVIDGTATDGKGSKRFAADVGVRGGQIVEIGKLGDAPAKRTLDATKLVVAPGFIDIHTHSDWTLLTDGKAESAIRQGVTTQVIGNCGSSPAPARELQKIEGHIFRSYAEYLKVLAESGTSINVGGLVGHNAIRAAVMGMVNRAPTGAELAQMKQHVADALKGGAVGLSTGLVTPPGTYSKTEEIIELARVVAEHGGLYASHMRGEARTVVASVREALRIGREAKVRVEISHHKAAGKENWGKTKETLPLIEAARRAGVKVHFDVYPYRAGSAGLSQLVPPWAHEGGKDAMLKRLKDPATRRKIAQDMTDGSDDWPNFFRIDWDDIQIASVKSEANQKWVGKKIGDLARSRGCSGVEGCIDLLIEESDSVQMINFIMDEEEMRRVLAHPLSIVGSDGTAVSPRIFAGSPHPRYYGCFPRVLGRYVRELKLLDLETAIAKMTSMPAAQLGWSDRGVLRKGSAADVVLFHPDKISDAATFERPQQYAVGIDTVIVNGQVVLHRGEHTGAKAGRVLRPMAGSPA